MLTTISKILDFSKKGNIINYFLNTNDRFTGYAGDPNYLSLYILIGIAVLLLINKEKNSVKNYIMILFLIWIGLLSSSKMFIVCLVFLFTIYICINLNKTNFLFKVFPIVLILLLLVFILLGQYINPFIEKTILAISVLLESPSKPRFVF